MLCESRSAQPSTAVPPSLTTAHRVTHQAKRGRRVLHQQQLPPLRRMLRTPKTPRREGRVTRPRRKRRRRRRRREPAASKSRPHHPQSPCTSCTPVGISPWARKWSTKTAAAPKNTKKSACTVHFRLPYRSKLTALTSCSNTWRTSSEEMRERVCAPHVHSAPR